jgi:hypothetical protein
MQVIAFNCPYCGVAIFRCPVTKVVFEAPTVNKSVSLLPHTCTSVESYRSHLERCALMEFVEKC